MNEMGWKLAQISFGIKMEYYIINFIPVITIKESNPGNIDFIAQVKSDTSFYAEYYSVPSTEAHPRKCDWYIIGY